MPIMGSDTNVRSKLEQMAGFGKDHSSRISSWKASKFRISCGSRSVLEWFFRSCVSRIFFKFCSLEICFDYNLLDPLYDN